MGVRTITLAVACAASWLICRVAVAQPIGASPQLDPALVGALRVEAPPIHPARDHRIRRHHRQRRSDAWRDVNAGVSTVFFRFFGNIAPSASGIERPSVDEHMLEAVVFPLAGTPLSYVLLGAGNNHVLTSSYFYREYEGMHALRLALVPSSARSPFQLSLTASPLRGSLSQVDRHSGIEENETTPAALLLGGAGGLDATYTRGILRVEARAYAMPELDVGHTGSSGVRQLQSLQVVLALTEMFEARPDIHFDLHFVGMHVERGDARAAVYDYRAQGFRSAAELRDLYQAMVVLAVRRE